MLYALSVGEAVMEGFDMVLYEGSIVLAMVWVLRRVKITRTKIPLSWAFERGVP